MKKSVKNRFKNFKVGMRTVLDTMIDIVLAVLGCFIFIIEGVLIAPITSIVDSIYRDEPYWRVLKGYYKQYLMKIDVILERMIGKMES